MKENWKNCKKKGEILCFEGFMWKGGWPSDHILIEKLKLKRNSVDWIGVDDFGETLGECPLEKMQKN